MGYGLRIEDDSTQTMLQIESVSKDLFKDKKMKGTLRSIEDNIHFEISQTFTKIGKENCDINIISPQIELKHAVLEYDNCLNIFLIEDLNTYHGTYVNDCRVQNSKVKVEHGDIVRFGHGGPRFEMLIDVQTNPSVIRQHVWEDDRNINLPYLPFQSTSTTIMTSKPYQTVSYGRYNGCHSHNKTVDITSTIPHPPPRQRPVSANPSNGVFLQTRPPSGSFSKDLSSSYVKPSEQVSDLEEQVLKMSDEITRLEGLKKDCFEKDNMICSLRHELENIRSAVLSDDTSRRLAILQNQITLKNQEIDHLQEENRKYKNMRYENSVSKTNKIAELQTLLSRHDQSISSMEKELTKSNKERTQLTSLISTLQKELSAKELLLKKSKTETEKYRVECRNKDMDISSLTAKIQRQTISDQAKKDLKKKDEELSSIRYRMKKADEKVNEREADVENLKGQLSRSNDSIVELQRSLQIMQQENTHYRSKSMKLENTEQSHLLQYEKLKRKYDQFFMKVGELFSQHGYKMPNPLDDTDALNYIKELRNELDKSQYRLEEVLNEKEQIESGMPSIEQTERLRNYFYDIESRLLRNGRTCNNLRQELQMLNGVEISEHYAWIKSFIVSMISQEFNWEQQIENALEAVKFCGNNSVTDDPTTLIHKLQIKLKDNAKQLDELEEKINSAEDEHSQLYKNIKEKIKEKYKKKMEEKLDEIKENEKKTYEKLRNDEVERVELELKIKDQELMNILRTQEIDNENSKNLKMKIEKMEAIILEGQLEVQKLKCELEEARENEDCMKKRMENREEEITLQKQVMDKKYQTFQNVELSLLKDKSDEQTMTINSLENTLLEINKEKKSTEMKLQKLKNLLKDQKRELQELKRGEEKGTFAMKKEIAELRDLNKTLRHNFTKAEKECEEQKDIVKTLKRDLEGLSVRMTDLKGELHDEQKLKVEELQEKLTKQEVSHLDQRNQLIKLSSLVEEQQKKLLEQEQALQIKNETLAYQADGLREDKVVGKQIAMVRPMATKNPKKIGERCLEERHDEVIHKQKLAIADMRNSLKEMDLHKKPHSVLEGMALQELSVLKKENENLKKQLIFSAPLNEINDHDLYHEVCKSRDILQKTFHDMNIEKLSHKDTQNALHYSEEMLLLMIRDVSEELEIKHVLGCQPMVYNDQESRQALVKDREKALENILNRIRTLQSRLKNKDKILENYDEDLKKLRNTEQEAGQKDAEVVALQKEISLVREENTYLQEALRRNRIDLENEKRLLRSMKQNKVMFMDYKKANKKENKSHSCYENELEKFKEEQKEKKKDELIKMKNYQIALLKQELQDSDAHLNEMNGKFHTVNKQNKESLSKLSGEENEDNLSDLIED